MENNNKITSKLIVTQNEILISDQQYKELVQAKTERDAIRDIVSIYGDKETWKVVEFILAILRMQDMKNEEKGDSDAE